MHPLFDSIIKELFSMDLMQFVNEVVFSFLEAVIILLLFTFLNDKKQFIRYNKFKSFIFCALYTIFSYWASTYIPPVFHTIGITAFMVIILSFITQVNIYASTITIGIIVILIIVTESVVLITEMILLKIDMATMLSMPKVKVLHSTLCKAVQLGVAVFLYRFNIKINWFNILKKESSTLSFAILQIFMMTMFMMSVNFVVSHQTDIMLYNILLFIIYLLFILLGFLDYKERERLLKIQYKFEAQEEYVKNMEIMMNVIRREKHDFANHLNTILAMCVLNKPDSLGRIETYIRKLTNSLKSSYHFFDTGNDYVDGLLAVKSNFAFENDIHLEVDIETPLSEAEVNDSHLTSIIGNIVDNAFEAIQTEQDRDGKVVSICTYIENNKYCLSISDNGPMIPEEHKDRIFENGFSTKSDKKEEHGFGLYIVKQLVAQNNGEITVSSTEDETEFLIRFNVRGHKNGEISSNTYQRNTA
jgi:signal transduction histidine kinase